jgi:hypothetical protein
VLALIYSTAYFDPSVDHRLAKHGYPSGTAQRILNERDKPSIPIGCAATCRLIAAMPTVAEVVDEGYGSTVFINITLYADHSDRL